MKKEKGCGCFHLERRSAVGEIRSFMGEDAKPVGSHERALRFLDTKEAREYKQKNDLSVMWEIVWCNPSLKL